MPEPTGKNITTQMGCHFEEVAEMLDEMIGLDDETAQAISEAREANRKLAEFLKTHTDNVALRNRTDFLDAMCDQIVTGVGVCHMYQMQIVEGMNEVNASNLSKFNSDGNPIFDLNLKVIKGPNYFKADLTQFV